ncbi:MAG: hypothetical protein HRU09_00285 [Oligoflexales bacterium]|nr:hypothetical protein [Oligoflexales bacterium]
MQQWQKRRWVILLASLFLVSFKIPEYYSKMLGPKEIAEELDYFIIEHNGESKLLKNKETLSYVRGDELKIKAAKLRAGDHKPSEVNLVGFRHPIKPGNRHDLGFLIDTSSTLDKKQWAVDEKGEVFFIAAASKKLLHGYAYLKRLEPSLSYVDIQVNDQQRVMREGETLKLSSVDLFKVSRVVTNIKNLDHVTFQVVELGDQGKAVLKSHELYEIRFKHRSHIFAKIPMEVEIK